MSEFNPHDKQEQELPFYVEDIPRSATINPYTVAEACVRITKPSAQSTVYQLPDVYGYDASLSSDPHEYFEVHRVIKVSNSTRQTKQAVETLMSIDDEAERANKPYVLSFLGRLSIQNAIVLASRYPVIDRLFGYPEFCPVIEDEHPFVTLRAAYTQDEVTPVHEFLEVLDMDDDSDFSIGKALVDAYVASQILLCSFGQYEQPLKFADNCGIHPSIKYGATIAEAFRIIDLGEIIASRSIIEGHIREKQWEKNHDKPEYSTLHPRLREYFNATFEQYFTLETVNAVWRNAYHTALLAQDTSLHIDRSIPRLLPEILWKQNLDALDDTMSSQK